MKGSFAAEVAVIGAGPAGLVAALALAGAGVETLLIAPQAVPDNRTTALLAGSVTALETLGVWQTCRPHAAPLEKIRLVDDTRRLFRAPEVIFAAAEIGLEAFGYNIENRHLIAALETRAGASLRRIAAPALALTKDADGVNVMHAGGEARVQLAIGADGARSLCRAAAGIATQRRSYPQAALTLNLAHQRPHRNISTEFHTENGPFTLVPLPGFRSSLVCVLEPAKAAQLKDEEEALLSADIEQRAHSLLGKVTVEPSRGVIPLAIETADAFGRGRIALVGEAAHVVPPIGAQGLNLGLRDAAAIAEIVADAWRQKRDVGAPEVVKRYDSERRADVATRRIAVDVLNRSLLTDFLPAHGARGVSLYLVDRIGPLRRALLREGVAPAASQPRLMRGEMA
ncbi:MAG TPA: UbiH/UbiF family hydroxylase [Xanthobacteraceae bacterium]|jgi:2-octaprenyl-6-methoxyphenol hydroxylase